MEINFRAWHKENKIMYRVKGFNFEMGMITVEDCDDSFWLDEVIIMQSTGFKDTDYVNELFDNDIISWSYSDEFEDSGKAQIVFKGGCWKLLDVYTADEVWESLYDCLENCTVFLLGNVYENPELIEV